MFTHLYVSKAQALKVLSALDIPEVALTGSDPIKLGNGLSATMEAGQLPELFVDEELIQEYWHLEGVFVLKFPRYLPRLPLTNIELPVLAVELVRLNSAPTKARAGYYEDKLNGFCALVERVVPTKQKSGDDLELVYAENIRVSALNLEHVQQFHTKLSEGKVPERYLVNAFE